MSKDKGEASARWQKGQILIQNQTPLPAERLRGLKQTLCTLGPRDPTETETELCLSISYRGTSQQWTATGTGALGAADWVWHKPSWRRSPLTPPQICQNLPRTRKQILGGHKQNLVHQDPGKGSVTPQETDPDLPVSIQEFPAQVWVMVACCRNGGTDYSSTGMRYFEGGHHCLHCLNHSLASGKQQGGNTAPPIHRKLN